jgi:Xaa-Pro aminopeptidase
MTPVDLLTEQNQQTEAQAKVAALRSLLATLQIDGYLIPSTDEHLNEYVPKAKQRRDWLSGFTGSAGDFLVGQEQSWLFVDPRYHEQAELQVDLSLIQVVKLGLEGHKTLPEVLETLGQQAIEQQTKFRLGFDPFTLTVEQFRSFQKQLEPAGVELTAISENLVDRIRRQEVWANETPPAYANSKIFSLSDEVTGEAIGQKLKRVREDLQQAKANIFPITKLDQIAWLFNLRGWDIPYNPVFIAYAIVTAEQAFLFTNLDRIDLELQDVLSTQVSLLPYEEYAETFKALIAQTDAPKVLLDTRQTTMGTYRLLVDNPSPTAAASPNIVEAVNPIEGMKAHKNAIEIEQMKQANLKASRAKTRTLKWLQDQLAQSQSLSELDVAHTVEGFYAQEEGFQGLSFNTIAARGRNSSIVHYGTPSPQNLLEEGQFLLLDSGAQYVSGTTDDTRTAIVGEPTPEQIEHYTEVLKAHINCAMQQFPKGTTGIQLDSITRASLWHSRLDYGHGTGHGVGAFLNVHEGPNGISKRAQAVLEPGMVTSIEPGFYKSGWGGIRIENLYVVVDLTPKDESSEDGTKTSWYGFESLTYIPFDNRLIDLQRLDDRQRQWLENYYAKIVEKLSPTLEPAEVEWLQSVCRLS